MTPSHSGLQAIYRPGIQTKNALNWILESALAHAFKKTKEYDQLIQQCIQFWREKLVHRKLKIRYETIIRCPRL